jgi:23S rRNA pseudouridine2605 synthase
MSEMRLQKWLSQLGIASRREAEKWISEGRLAVNGKTVKELGTKVNIDSDHVALDGKLVKAKVPPKVFWLLHKPDKTLTARSDELTNKPTIYDLPMVSKAKFLVSPVGRLDFRTEGLLLLTNDGELSYKLCRPEYHVPREYQVLLDGRLTKEEEQQFKKGITLEDGPVQDVRITYVHGANMGVSTGSWYLVTVHEGRNRLVRRLFEHFNKRVVRLIRIGFGEIRLPSDLPAGEYRQLSTDQVATLRKSTEAPRHKNTSKRISGSTSRALRKPIPKKSLVKTAAADKQKDFDKLKTDRTQPQKPLARKPEARKPDARKPEARKPEARKPEARKPEARKPEARKPDARKPDARKPDARKPDARKPDARKPDARKPDARKPDARKPDARKPASRSPQKTPLKTTQRKSSDKRGS